MKKLILTAAFTSVGVIAVSAQTETTQQNSSQNSNNQTTATQNSQATANWGTVSDTANQNTGTKTVPVEATAQISADTAVDKTRSTDAIKEEKKAKKKKSK